MKKLYLIKKKKLKRKKDLWQLLKYTTVVNYPFFL